ncbi:unnamed protein product, partial [Polarella glacialis]
MSLPMTTPPPRQQQPRHPHRVLPDNKENHLAQSAAAAQVAHSPPYPMRSISMSQAPVSPVQTPTKTAPSADAQRFTSAAEKLGQKHPWPVEVKNTFIHYGSPVKTVTVVTPPKTVPSNFAPEALFREYGQFRHAPLPVLHRPLP